VAAALIGAVEKRRSGIASGVLNTARQLGVALGVAGFGALIAGEGRMLSGLHAALVLAVGAAALAAVAAALTISAPSRR
jgi:DHA2 family methylenomycin A resistance protein-like MFS transporter